jgi:sulfur carrier protein ThiS
MCVHVIPVGSLKNYTGGKQEVLIEAGLTIREMMTELEIPPEIVALVLVNGTHQHKDYIPTDGDTVTLVAIFRGGTLN